MLLPVIQNGTFYQNVTLTNRSGTIAAGGVAQSLCPLNEIRKGFLIQNQHATDSLYINELGSLAIVGQPSIEIKAGATFVSPLTGCSSKSVSIISATVGVPFAAREW